MARATSISSRRSCRPSCTDRTTFTSRPTTRSVERRGTEEIVGRKIIDVFPANPHGVPILDRGACDRSSRKCSTRSPVAGCAMNEIDDGFADVILAATTRAGGRHHHLASSTSPSRSVLSRGPHRTLGRAPRTPRSGPERCRRARCTGAVLKVNRAAQSLLGGGPYRNVSAESAKLYRLRDAATGRDLPPVGGCARARIAGRAPPRSSRPHVPPRTRARRLRAHRCRAGDGGRGRRAWCRRLYQ